MGAGTTPEDHGQLHRARLARDLGQAIDAALERGHLPRARRIARSAEPLARRFPRLAVRIARLQLIQDRPETALRAIDDCHHGSAALKLLRAVCLVQLDRPEAAPAWSRIIKEMSATSDEGLHEMVRALVESAKGTVDPELARLLIVALTKALPMLPQPALAEEALARLLLLLGEPLAARRWARKALSRAPMSVSAAMLLRLCHQALFGLEEGPDDHGRSAAPAGHERAA